MAGKLPILIDIGADMIIGGHPHIVQGYEVSKKKPIFYSLGNFYFDDDKMKNITEWNRNMLITINTDQIERSEVILVSLQGDILNVDISQDFQDAIEIRKMSLCDRAKLEQMADNLADSLWYQCYRSYYEGIFYSTRIDNMSLRNIFKYSLRRCLTKLGEEAKKYEYDK
jgi:poly-gamma-glutamate synthesis protein (capsule biosynthesis protein)